jgi:hypothetical protein
MLVILQVLTSDVLSINGILPDISLIFLIWIVIEKGQLKGEL